MPLNDGLTMMDVSRGAVRFRFSGHAAGDSLVATPDGRLLAGRKTSGTGTKGKSGDILIWEMATGKVVVTVATGGFDHLAMAPDNRILVITDEQFLRVLDLATGKERRRWPLPVAGTDSWGRTFVFGLLLSPDGRRAFTALADGTALVWDLTPALRPAEPLARDAGAMELAAWWADLADEDAKKAQGAVWALADVPKQAVPFLGGRLKAIVPPDEKRVQRWIAELDSDNFDTREGAFKELSRVDELIEPLARNALGGKVPPETRRRLEGLLQAISVIPATPDDLRQLRAVQALELIGSPEARSLLRGLGKGAPGAQQTREAQESLDRLNKRPSSVPP
jgi:hypothetical protein